ncbi:MAG: hypothetical protein WC867_03525 [Candidatus Pacearchaeota archaeon]|jgi:hypothetical protein
MLSIYDWNECIRFGLDKFIEQNDFQGALSAAHLEYTKANENYYRFSEPGDGINDNISAGVGEIFRIKSLIGELEKELIIQQTTPPMGLDFII